MDWICYDSAYYHPRKWQTSSTAHLLRNLYKFESMKYQCGIFQATKYVRKKSYTIIAGHTTKTGCFFDHEIPLKKQPKERNRITLLPGIHSPSSWNAPQLWPISWAKTSAISKNGCCDPKLRSKLGRWDTSMCLRSLNQNHNKKTLLKLNERFR